MTKNTSNTDCTSELAALSERIALGIREAAAALGVSEGLVRKCLPELPHVHLGERVLIPVDELKHWFQERARAERVNTKSMADQILRVMESGDNDKI
jgi:excisionase family DNA binding protein